MQINCLLVSPEDWELCFIKHQIVVFVFIDSLIWHLFRKASSESCIISAGHQRMKLDLEDEDDDEEGVPEERILIIFN